MNTCKYSPHHHLNSPVHNDLKAYSDALSSLQAIEVDAIASVFETITQFLYPAGVQIKWDISVHGRDLYPLKPTLGTPE